MYKRERTAVRLKAASIRMGAAALAFSALLSGTLAAPATVTAQNGLRLRAEASSNSRILTTLPSGTELEVLEHVDSTWARVQAGQHTGYVSSQYISPVNRTQYATVKASSLNVRSGPGSSYAKVSSLSSGTQVEILEEAGGWYRIEGGYISAEYVTVSSEPAQPKQPAEPVKQYGTVKASSLNVRSGPGSSYAKVSSLSSGTQVEILEQTNGWYRIEGGYVSAQYIALSQPSAAAEPQPEPVQQPAAEPQPEPTPEPTPAQTEPAPEQAAQDGKTYGMVSASSLNVRSGPGSSYDKVSTLSSGAQVEILEQTEGWYRIEGGYVSADYILILDGSMSSLQAQIVAYAHTFLGCAYVYGGNGPKSFDCSGLTKYVYKHFGYNINRTATQQLKNGVPVSKENLQPGDLVFFNSEGTGIDRATHVGIYIGNGNFLHASNKRLGVTITSLSDAYRVKTYTTARRIL